MSTYHEPYESLSPADRDLHRALVSFKEEIEAVDWYHQRVATCTDPLLAEVLAHNRDEEIEHACMTLEWLRRCNPVWDAALRRFVFTTGSITQREPKTEPATGAASKSGAEVGGGPASPRRVDLGIGSLHDAVEPGEARATAKRRRERSAGA